MIANRASIASTNNASVGVEATAGVSAGGGVKVVLEMEVEQEALAKEPGRNQLINQMQQHLQRE